jgi:FMN reductase
MSAIEPAPPTSPGGTRAICVVAVNGSPSHPSRSRAVAEVALDLAGGEAIIDLAGLDPAALLAISSDPAVEAARDQVAAADVLIVATPVYRATYTALTKTIFDLLPQDALTGTVVIPIATGYVADHRLAIDHGLRPLIASLGGWTTPTGVYATRADIADDGTLSGPLQASVEAAVGEALTLAVALAPT